MKTRLLLTFLCCVLFAQAPFAQHLPPALDCYKKPNPIPNSDLHISQQMRSAADENKVAVFYVIPADADFVQAEYDAIQNAMIEIQAWYQINTGGVAFTYSYSDIVEVYRAKQNTSYYSDDWWGKLLPEMQQQGLPIWQSGTVAGLWIKTGNPSGIGLGAQWCDSFCGVAMAGVENFPEFNSSGECSGGTGVYAWPCVPHGTMGHELGHAFGLPHPADVAETNAVARHSIMQTHWNYPSYAPPSESPWGLLTVERTTLWDNPFFQQDISLRQIYNADIVNLPVTGQAPTIRVGYKVDGRTVSFSNNTSGAILYYWTFGDGSVSNDPSPSQTYSSPGSYTIALRASGATGMTALQEITVEVKDPVIIAKKPKKAHLGPVKIFPNPNETGHFTVTYPPLPFQFRLTVYNSMGNVLFSKTINDTSQDQQLDLSSYGRGFYFVKLEMKGAKLTQKLIVL